VSKLRGGRIRPGDDEVRRERDDPFEIEGRRISDTWQRSRLRRPVAVRDRAHRGRCGARRIEELGRVRGEADDALRRPRQRDGGADIIADDNFGTRRDGRDGREQRQRQRREAQ
jgi:hypothetical protein